MLQSSLHKNAAGSPAPSVALFTWHSIHNGGNEVQHQQRFWLCKGSNGKCSREIAGAHSLISATVSFQYRLVPPNVNVDNPISGIIQVLWKSHVDLSCVNLPLGLKFVQIKSVWYHFFELRDRYLSLHFLPAQMYKTNTPVLEEILKTNSQRKLSADIFVIFLSRQPKINSAARDQK